MSSAVRWLLSFLFSISFIGVILLPYFLPKYGAMIYSGSTVAVCVDCGFGCGLCVWT